MQNLKTRNLLFVAAAGLGAWWLLTRSQLAGRTKIVFRRIRLIGKGISKQFELNFKIQNPTNQTSTISALTGEVIVNDQIVADFSSFGEQKIAPKTESDLKVLATPTGGLLQLLTTKGWLRPGVTYTIRGTGNFDGIVVPFEYQSRLF